MQVWELIIASGIIGMVFAFGQQLVMWKLGRKAAKEDQAELNIEVRIKALEEKVDRLSIGQKSILHDRIKGLGMSYIAAQAIDINDRRDLIEMHKAYHANGGNGNLDKLMEEVERLPLRTKTK